MKSLCSSTTSFVSVLENSTVREFCQHHGAEWNSCLVTCGLQGFRGAADISLADKKVEIAVATHGGIAIGLHGECWAFDDERGNVFRREELQKTKQLSDHT